MANATTIMNTRWAPTQLRAGLDTMAVMGVPLGSMPPGGPPVRSFRSGTTVDPTRCRPRAARLQPHAIRRRAARACATAAASDGRRRRVEPRPAAIPAGPAVRACPPRPGTRAGSRRRTAASTRCEQPRDVAQVQPLLRGVPDLVPVVEHARGTRARPPPDRRARRGSPPPPSSRSRATRSCARTRPGRRPRRRGPARGRARTSSAPGRARSGPSTAPSGWPSPPPRRGSPARREPPLRFPAHRLADRDVVAGVQTSRIRSPSARARSRLRGVVPQGAVDVPLVERDVREHVPRIGDARRSPAAAAGPPPAAPGPRPARTRRGSRHPGRRPPPPRRTAGGRGRVVQHAARPTRRPRTRSAGAPAPGTAATSRTRQIPVAVRASAAGTRHAGCRSRPGPPRPTPARPGLAARAPRARPAPRSTWHAAGPAPASTPSASVRDRP